jgi:DinB superfamily
MDESLRVVIEMNEYTWNGFRSDLDDVTPEEVNWRPVPEANTINLIVRHLRIDLPWHVRRIGKGDEGPDADSNTQAGDSVPLDFERNLQVLDDLYTGFIGALRGMTLGGLERQSGRAYRDAGQGSAPGHFLGFHWAVHLARHWGQVRTLRNLYRKTRGEPARFFPDNPTFPQ